MRTPVAAVEGNTMPNTPNSNHPFPDADTQQRAETAAAELLDRFTLAKRTLQAAANDGSNAEVGEALRNAANLTTFVHRLIAVGWWFDQPF